jgi:C-terminal processing protease CtpA/Prc
VLSGKSNQPRIGYVHIPRFYGGEQGIAADLFNHITYLKAEKVEGILLDVRGNMAVLQEKL